MRLTRIPWAIWQNMGTALLALGMALAVWVTAVVAADPNVEDETPRVVSLQINGLSPDLLIVGEVEEQVEVRLGAPQSVIERLDREPNLVQASVNLSDLEAGEHQLAVTVTVNDSPVRILELAPEVVTVNLEVQATQTMAITPKISGVPALGYQTETLSLSESVVQVAGPQSLVVQVSEVLAELDVSEASETLDIQVTLKPVDENGQLITGLTLEPATVSAVQQISQSERYRNVAVVVKIVGQPASGYRLTNISVSPPSVTLFSSDPEKVLELPGFVETLPLDITDKTDDVEARLALDLEEGIEVVGGEQSVQVLVGIAAIESSIAITEQVEVRGLAPGLAAEVSPEEVNAILAGPLSALENLQPEDVIFYVDVSELGVGTYTLTIQVEILPEEVRIESMTLEMAEVTITISLTPTGTGTPGITPTPTPN